MKLSRIIPLVILLIALGLFFYFRLYHYLSLDALQTYRQKLLLWTTQHYFLVSLIFFLAYTLAVAISIPGATFLTLAGGFMFGPVVGSIYVIAAATIGATVIYFAAKTAFADYFRTKAKGYLNKFAEGFRDNAASYLLFLRLVPLFPFWLVNIVPGLFGVNTRTFVWTTLVGIIPGSVVYVLVGNGLGAVFDAGQTVNLSIIFKPTILVPLVLLGILSLVPILYNRWKRLHAKTTL